MADAIVLANRKAVRKSFFEQVSFHKNGFVNEFSKGGKSYVALYAYGDINRFTRYCEANAYYKVLRDYDNQDRTRPRGVLEPYEFDPNLFNSHLAVPGEDRVFIQLRIIKAGSPRQQCKEIKSWILVGNEPFDITSQLAPPGTVSFQFTEECNYLDQAGTAIFTNAEARKNDDDLPESVQWDDDIVADIAELVSSMDSDIVTVLQSSGIINTQELLNAQNQIWTNDPDDTDFDYYSYSNDDLIAYRDYLKNYKSWFLSNREKINTVTEPEKMYLVVGAFSAKALQLLEVDEKIKILNVIAQGSILGYWFGTGRYNEEALVIRLIKAVTVPQASDFLEKLGKQRQISPSGSYYSIFELLYSKIGDELIFGLDDNNRKELMRRLYFLWIVSAYNPENEFDFTNDSTVTEDFFSSFENNPVILNYESSRTFGFNIDNMKFPFIYQKISAQEDNRIVGNYNYYQPVTIKDYKEDAVAIKIPRISLTENGGSTSALIPLFFLKYLDDYGDSEDLWTAIGLTVDIALTFTGIGNLTKLRHLRHSTKLGRLAIGKSLPAGAKILALEGLIGVAGLFEFTASMASIFWNYYSDGCKIYKGDDPNDSTPGVIDVINDSNESGQIPEQPNNPDYNWCKNLDQFLFWVQMASAGTDLISSLMVRKTARKIIDDGDIPDDFLDLVDDASGVAAYDVLLRCSGTMQEMLPAFRGKMDTILGTPSSLRSDFDTLLNPSQQRLFIYHFAKKNTDDIKILDNIGDPPSLVKEWKEITYLKYSRKNLDFLKSFRRFTNKNHEVEHITDITNGSNPPNFKIKGGHGHKNIDSGDILNPNDSSLPDLLKSEVISKNGHNVYKPIWFKLPVGTSPPANFTSNFQFYNGNWYRKKPEHTVWKSQWNDLRIKEEMAFAYANKKPNGPRNLNGTPNWHTPPPVFYTQSYTSKLSDGTKVEIKMSSIAKDPVTGGIVQDHLSLFTLILK